MSSDTPRVVCLHEFGFRDPLQPADLHVCPQRGPNVPIICGSRVYGQQLAVEHAIDQEYPEIHAERFPRWVEQDLALFSMQRHTSFHQSTKTANATTREPAGATSKIGYSRWRCPALDGRVGCPLRDGTVAVARQLGQPIDQPPEEPTDFCIKQTVRIPPGRHMKYGQEEYWADPAWQRSWNRRSYVEAVFGNLKIPNPENIHRGVFQLVGLSMVTLAITAAVVPYNVRELNNWHRRTGNGEPSHPLLGRTKWVNGFAVITQEDAAALDSAYASEQLAAW